MELRYQILEEEHARFVHSRRRARALSPSNLIFTALMVAFPLFALGLVIYQNLFSGQQLVLCAVGAVALSATNLWVRGRHWRKDPPKRADPARSPDDDFWKEHHFTADKDGVTIRCGKLNRFHDWSTFSGFMDDGDILIPIFNGQPSDLIPVRALASVGGKDAFQAAILDIARDGLRQSVKEAISSAEELTPAVTLHYRYTRETYLRDQRDATRRRYTTAWLFDRANLIRFGLVFLMLYAAIVSSSALMKVVYFLFLFLLLFGHIATFTPILDKRLLKDMQTLVALNPGQEATFQVFTKRLRVVGDLHYLEFPLSEIQTMRRLPHGLALYLNAQIILTIPGSPENTDEELDRLYHFIRLAKGRK